MMRHIQKCAEAEAHSHLNETSWSVSLPELDATISIMYARSIYGATDNYFTSLRLCATAKTGKQDLFSSIIFRTGTYITLTSYWEKKNKNVLILSSLHTDVTFNKNEKKLGSAFFFAAI